MSNFFFWLRTSTARLYVKSRLDSYLIVVHCTICSTIITYSHAHINSIILTGSMRVARKHHLCEKYIMNSMEVILAAGGTSASEEMLDTVEIFFIVNEVWSTMVQAKSL